MMPSTLDISRASHGKSFISPPRINLRKAAAYNYDKGPLSSTSSRFNFNHLVFSPPPSPGLPSISPPVKRPPRRVFGRIRPIRIVRYTIRLLSIVVVFFVALDVLTRIFGEPVPPPAPEEPTENTGAVQEAAASQTGPSSPMPIMVSDSRGRAKWTVSIPRGSEFPLTMQQYAEMCGRCEEVAERTRNLRSQGLGFSLGFGSDAANDFVDVQEAQDAGYLHAEEKSSEDLAGEVGDTGKPVCKKSLTFVLESDDAGLGKTLMMLWISYGLAVEEGRAFFVDDTRWAYGRYADMFQSLPQPDCAPPPSHEMLPCPRHARHLIASAATTSVWLDPLTQGGGSSSSNGPSISPPNAHERTFLKAQFDLARRGYEALFRLTKEDADYVDARARELMAKRILLPRSSSSSSSSSKSQYNHGLAVGIHVRRGDRHPLEPQYRDSYMPLHLYADVAREVIDSRLGGAGKDKDESEYEADDDDAARRRRRTAREKSMLVLASDDPTVYASTELDGSGSGVGGGGVRAQERIRLASKQPTPTPTPNKAVMRKFVDRSFGWEGGFFAAMFWNLGTVTVNAAESAAAVANRHSGSGNDTAAGQWSPETLRLRSLVGRAYMLDLAVLAEASDVVVCAVSAVGCRLLAVMMGWQSAFEEGNWVNIEGGYGWLGVEW
ncbi:hypothetical protein VTJ49DRAFT_6281 [Mycothermus thermophilus]|uniref:Uncharacterized protein n=1 Tax=Humicola insolens TaxID=85995 RepID=A0ABR3VJ86_HUMIN